MDFSNITFCHEIFNIFLSVKLDNQTQLTLCYNSIFGLCTEKYSSREKKNIFLNLVKFVLEFNCCIVCAAKQRGKERMSSKCK